MSPPLEASVIGRVAKQVGHCFPPVILSDRRERRISLFPLNFLIFLPYWYDVAAGSRYASLLDHQRLTVPVSCRENDGELQDKLINIATPSYCPFLLTNQGRGGNI
jgi:hypothetical protein